MEYEVFKYEVLRHIADHLEIGVDVRDRIIMFEDGYCGQSAEEEQFILETNDRYGHRRGDFLVGDYIILKSDNCGSRCGYMCRFSVHYLYGAYKCGGWDRVHYVVDENIHGASTVDTNVLESLDTYNQVKTNLIVCLRNSAKTKLRYRDAVIQKMADMAMILYVIVRDDGSGNRLVAPVPRNATLEWGLTDDDILAAALDNTARRSPPRLYLGFEDMMGKTRDVGEFMSPTSSIHSIPRGPFAATLTAIPQADGATALFYPGVMERISSLAGGNYYVVFTGKDEARIHPDGVVSVAQMQNGLKDVNHRFPETMLTNFVFFYDSKQKKLRRI